MQKITNAKRRIGAVLSIMALSAFMALPAFATPAPTGAEDAIDAGFAQLTGLVTGTLAVGLFLIVVTILGVIMGVRWLAKGSKAS